MSPNYLWRKGIDNTFSCSHPFTGYCRAVVRPTTSSASHCFAGQTIHLIVCPASILQCLELAGIGNLHASELCIRLWARTNGVIKGSLFMKKRCTDAVLPANRRNRHTCFLLLNHFNDLFVAEPWWSILYVSLYGRILRKMDLRFVAFHVSSQFPDWTRL